MTKSHLGRSARAFISAFSPINCLGKLLSMLGPEIDSDFSQACPSLSLDYSMLYSIGNQVVYYLLKFPRLFSYILIGIYQYRPRVNRPQHKTVPFGHKWRISAPGIAINNPRIIHLFVLQCLWMSSQGGNGIVKYKAHLLCTMCPNGTLFTLLTVHLRYRPNFWLNFLNLTC